MLDDKLREILFNASGGISDMANEEISQIKAAFAKWGYSKPTVSISGDTEAFKKLGFMTGQEWYDKFRKEYRALSLKAYIKDRYAKMAAERAAGIDN